MLLENDKEEGKVEEEKYQHCRLHSRMHVYVIHVVYSVPAL